MLQFTDSLFLFIQSAVKTSIELIIAVFFLYLDNPIYDFFCKSSVMKVFILLDS